MNALNESVLHALLDVMSITTCGLFSSCGIDDDEPAVRARDRATRLALLDPRCTPAATNARLVFEWQRGSIP